MFYQVLFSLNQRSQQLSFGLPKSTHDFLTLKSY